MSVSYTNIASPPASRPGESLYRAGDVIASKYRLITPLGEGGMGAVWQALNTTLHMDVAIKLIHRDLGAGDWEEASGRLLKEARAIAQLAHPSIVRVNDFGETEHGDPFIVMELLDGESLDKLLEREGKLPAVRAVQMLLPIASALAEAHAKGIVHRDLKPENIILVVDSSGNQVPKLLDFGIAMFSHEQVLFVDREGLNETEAHHLLAKKLTKFGSLIGSPDYMSPEQARGDAKVDERADLWALCVMLYQAVAGRRPFAGDGVEELLMAILLGQPVPITELGIGDQELWRIIARGLEKDRSKRWPDARKMGQHLAQWLDDRGMDADVAGVSIRQHWLQELPSPQISSRQLAAFPPSDANDSAALPAGRARSKSAVAVAAAGVVALAVIALLAVTQPWTHDAEADAMGASAAVAAAPAEPTATSSTTALTAPDPAVASTAQPSAESSAAASTVLPAEPPAAATAAVPNRFPPIKTAESAKKPPPDLPMPTVPNF